MNAPVCPVLLAPVRQRWAVKIVFDDGQIYEQTVNAYSWESARWLALTDARMQEGGGHSGKVLSISADRPP